MFGKLFRFAESLAYNIDFLSNRLLPFLFYKDAFVDAGRSAAFAMAKIRTALAVPIFTDGVFTPACVLCCYSLVRTDAVPFVLRFVQQALRLVWMGLDQVEPHESVGKDLWKDVAPADLGEMAADTEMQQAFMVGKQKRTHDDISSSTVRDRNICGSFYFRLKRSALHNQCIRFCLT